MNSLFVLKNVTTTTVTTPANIQNIAAGELVVIGDGKIVLTGQEGELQDIKYVQFFGRKDDGSIVTSVPIKRRTVDKVNWQIYKAPVLGVYTIGSTSAATLPYDDTIKQEYGLIMHNQSYNKIIDTQRLNISLTNNIGETKLAFYTRLVAKLNNTSPTLATKLTVPFYTAAVSGTGNNILITFTMKNSNIDFALSAFGALEGISKTTVTKPQPGIGVGADVRAMEKDYSSSQGYQGYVTNSDVWYSASLDAAANGTYSSATVEFTTENDSPSVKRLAARNTIAFFYPNGATAVATKLATFLSEIFGDAWAAREVNNSAEPGANIPDNDSFDGVVTEGADTTP